MAKFIKVHRMNRDTDAIPTEKIEMVINVNFIESIRENSMDPNFFTESIDSVKVRFEIKFHKSVINIQNGPSLPVMETVSEIEDLISKPSECGKSFTSD